MTKPPSSDEKNAELNLELQRFEFEKAKALRDEDREKERAKAERTASHWNRLAIVLPIIGAIVGYFIQSAVTRKTGQLKFIDRQLSELYYPVQLRLKKDTALTDFWKKYQGDDKNKAVLEEIKYNAVLKNDLEVVTTLEKHFDLLRNSGENTDIQKLIDPLLLYDRHVELFSALHAVEDKRSPNDVDTQWGYPKEFEVQIDNRVRELEQQRLRLNKRWF